MAREIKIDGILFFGSALPEVWTEINITGFPSLNGEWIVVRSSAEGVVISEKMELVEEGSLGIFSFKLYELYQNPLPRVGELTEWHSLPNSGFNGVWLVKRVDQEKREVIVIRCPNVRERC